MNYKKATIVVKYNIEEDNKHTGADEDYIIEAIDKYFSDCDFEVITFSAEVTVEDIEESEYSESK